MPSLDDNTPVEEVINDQDDTQDIDWFGSDDDDDTSESETTETKTTEESEEKEEVKEDDSTEEKTDDETDDTKDDSKDEQLTEEQKRKAHNKEMAERRIQEKQEREDKVLKDQADYLDEAGDESTDVAIRQLQVDAYNNRVERNTDRLTTQYEKALKDFDILTSDSPEIKEEVDAAVDAFQAMHVKIDKYGNPVDVTGDLYKYLERKAKSIESLTSIGARKQETDKAREKSKTISTPNRSPKKSDDKLMDILLAD